MDKYSKPTICNCGKHVKEHSTCEACDGVLRLTANGCDYVSKPVNFRGHLLCESCLARWMLMEKVAHKYVNYREMALL